MGIAALASAGPILQIGVAALGVASNVIATSAANSAAQQQAQAQQAELARQSKEENRIANEERSDRAREADKEFASFLARGASTGGALGTISMTRGAQEIGFIEGIDLARIEGNRVARQGAIGARSATVARGARRAAKTSRVNQFANLVGGAGQVLSIKTAADARKVQRTIAEGRV